MRSLFFFSLVLFSLQCFSSEQADQKAKNQFFKTHFFSDGRGMHLSPGLISLYNLFTNSKGQLLSRTLRNRLETRWGLVFDQKIASGLFDVPYRKMHVGVVGCVVCHSGKAAGQFVVGLGNKNIDVVQLAKDVHKLEQTWHDLVPGIFKTKAYVDVEQDALKFSKYLSNEQIGNLTQGLVPVSFIRGWFYRVQGEKVPAQMTRGQVKVPALWGYGVKRRVGQFCDGYGNGEEIGWAVAVELAAGQRSSVVRGYKEKVEKAEDMLSDFLPPPYPFATDVQKAQLGKQIFDKTCANCHGTYERDIDNFPLYKEPKFINWSVIRTDYDRLKGNTEAFNAQVDKSPLKDLIKYNNWGPGYFAPRLEGVWARFPYLHNGSIPNVYSLLQPPALRPKVFSLKKAGEKFRFSEHKLGLTDVSIAELRRNTRDIYNTQRIGHSNDGHDFYTDMSDENRHLIIEYLKTL